MSKNEKMLSEEQEFEKAWKELGEERFMKHYREVFGVPCLDYVDTIVINLPESCYCDCYYCIDKYLRPKTIDSKSFLEICEKVFNEFPNTKRLVVTGGTLQAEDFNYLLNSIRSYFPNASITWNTNGILVNEDYKEGISMINHINLHRNSVDDKVNQEIFRTNMPIMSIEEAKEIFGENLTLRITVDKDFDLDEYASLGLPLYLNRLLPGTKETNEVFKQTLKKLNISDEKDRRRRNVYLSSDYNGINIRLGLGDKAATCVPGRKPVYLNVAIIHRSGIVCGSWFENDKVLYDPKNVEKKLIL